MISGGATIGAGGGGIMHPHLFRILLFLLHWVKIWGSMQFHCIDPQTSNLGCHPWYWWTILDISIVNSGRKVSYICLLSACVRIIGLLAYSFHVKGKYFIYIRAHFSSRKLTGGNGLIKLIFMYLFYFVLYIGCSDIFASGMLYSLSCSQERFSSFSLFI